VHTFVWNKGKRVVVHTDYFKRYGSKREEILRHTLKYSRTDVPVLNEYFGSKTSKPGRFFKTWVKPMIDDGVLAGDRGSVEPAEDWQGALEVVRQRTEEPQDNAAQSRKYAERRKAYRERAKAEERGDAPKPEPTPGLAGEERVAEMVAKAEERDKAARLEEQRRKVGMTAEVFLADTLQGISGFGWRELRALWMAKGGKSEDLCRAVKHPYRFRREHDTGPLYVERVGAAPEPDPWRDPAPVTVLRETETHTKPETESPPEDWRSHPLACPCDDCAAGTPSYARAWSGA
jgi:hypothetical protein